MITSTAQLITGEELAQMGDIGPCELIDGRIVPLSPADVMHGVVTIRLGSRLEMFVSKHDLGHITGGEVGIYIQRNPDRIRAADVAFVSKQKSAEPISHFLDVAPELVVEIISPSDRWQDIRAKLIDYFSIGVERVWIVEPEPRKVLVYQSPTVVTELQVDDTLEGEGLLTGFRLNVADIFA